MAELSLRRRLVEQQRVSTLVGEYLQRLAAGGSVVALHHDPDGAPHEWYLRLEGDTRDYVAIWLRVRERTLAVESYLMPPPEENETELYLYLLKVNHGLVNVKFGIGGKDETGVFLTGHVPVEWVDESVVDELVGTCWEAIEQHFSTAMSIGYASSYRRRRQPPRAEEGV